MISRVVLSVYRALRSVLLPRLSAADRAEMDELIARRVWDARARPAGAVVVWARELLDLFTASLRGSSRFLIAGLSGAVGMGSRPPTGSITVGM